MAINEWKLWKRLGIVKEVADHSHAKPLDDLKAVHEYLTEAQSGIEKLLPLFEQLKNLVDEQQVAQQGALQINLEAQAAVYDKLIMEYESLQDDIDINGIRLKRLVEYFLNSCQEAGLKDLAKEKATKPPVAGRFINNYLEKILYFSFP